MTRKRYLVTELMRSLCDLFTALGAVWSYV